jgi:hypothetical protein
LSLTSVFSLVSSTRHRTETEGSGPAVACRRDVDSPRPCVRPRSARHHGRADGVLEAGRAALLDVEQIVVRGRLTLDILIDVPPGNTIIKDLLFYGWEKDLRLDFEVVEDAPASTAPVRRSP